VFDRQSFFAGATRFFSASKTGEQLVIKKGKSVIFYTTFYTTLKKYLRK
jgi:hypothetical protein